jgi:ABC-type uncharacterized transport system permease subunit
MRIVRLIWGYVRIAFLQWFAWRSFIFTLAVNQAVTPLIGLALWSTALPERSFVSYYIVLLFVRLATVSYENHTFSGAIYQGDLADLLLRPHAAILSPLGENIAMRIWHIVIVIPLIVLVMLVVPLQLSMSNLWPALPALLLAAALQFVFTFGLAISAFWSERAHGITNFGRSLIFLLGGEAVPIALLPDQWRALGELLPFRAMLGFPAEIASGLLSHEAILRGYAVQAVWLLLMGGAVYLLWLRGVRRFTAVGA